jgi:hypothetical protein
MAEYTEVNVIQVLDVYFVVPVGSQRVREDTDAAHLISGYDGFILNLHHP